MTTAREILIKGLQAMGADGLVNPDLECGCHLDDLAPAGVGCMDIQECRAARWIAPDSPDADQEMLEDFPEGYFTLMEEQ